MLVPVCLLLCLLQQCLCVDLTYHVEERKSPGTQIGDIAADTNLMESFSDHDKRLITFNLLQKGATKNSHLFHFSKKSGKLYTAKQLDAEDMCIQDKECFQMIDIAVRKGTSFIKLLEIKVIIEDINDHKPEFPDKNVHIIFSERDGKGTKITIPYAVDKDVGTLNSQITYHLKKNKDEPFGLLVSKSIDGTSKLSIQLEERLDRELKEIYKIQVIAKDGGSPPKEGVMNVHISVSDVNDNTPVFSQSIYNVSVNNKIGAMPVLSLSANDLDSGENGRVSYRLSPKTSKTAKAHFDLNEETGEITLIKKFILGQELSHKLYVEAIDSGSPPSSSIAKVLVNVINQQNNPPNIDVTFVFKSSDNTTTISENIVVGSFIAYVKVTDHDLGQNGEVKCNLHHDKFQLQSFGTNKYKIILKSPVNRESENHHDVVIDCQDKGLPPLHRISKFSVNVTDVNDVKPQFSKEIYKFRIAENERSNLPVGTINATDPDLGSGGKMTYSLLTDNKHFLPFQITVDGLILTINSLDHELQDVYKFQVLVKDHGIPSLNNTVNVSVEVTDENDNAPYFTFPSVNPFVMDHVYYPHQTKNITVLRASDSDSRENAFLKYEIYSGNEKQLFTIDHYMGLLSFTRVVTPQDAGSYDLEFLVKDSGTPVQSAKTTIFLTLTVSNKTVEVQNAVKMKTDEKIHLNLVIIITLISVIVSVIITASMSICILRYCHRRNIPQGEQINTPHRCPNDQRHLMCPSYHTSSWPDVPAAVSAQSKSNIHLIEPKRISQEKVNIGHRGSPQKLHAPTEIIHQRCIQEVTAENEKNAIMIPSYNQWRSTKSYHSDGGHGWNENELGKGKEKPDLPKMAIPKYVILFVIHRCFCVDLTYYVEEGRVPRTLVGDIALDLQLMDRETTQNDNLITFNILQQSVNGNFFRVSKNTGKLYTSKMLDAESMCKRERECFQMIDVAIRKGTSFIKLLEVKVIIQDINDHQPEFPNKQVSIEFSEDDRKGAKRSIPNAVDKDVGIINSQITYQLKKNKDEPFTLAVLERVDGTSDLSILLKERLDRELKDSYMIQVVANDQGSPHRQSILDIHITVMDVNDNIPVFSQKSYNVSVNNEHERNIPVIIVSANDLDSGENGRITYHLSSKTSDTAKLHFMLNKNNGGIFLRKKFSLGQELLHKLYIEAIDGGNPPLNSLAMVLINIINQQNNPPIIDTNFVFRSTANTTVIAEDIEVGSFIGYVKVTDHDAGQNGVIKCDLHHDKFQLQSLSLKRYKIILKNPVDREIEDHHKIIIKCYDQGSPPLHAEKVFSINVTDVNDVRPQFLKEIYRFKIDENQKSKIQVGFINATDPDLGPGGRLTYSLRTNNKEFLPFQITEDELISTISSLDHEFQNIYRFQVFVKDNGIPSLNNSVNVIVEVNDENDNTPYFTFPSINPFTMDILYYPQHTKNITVLKAADSDSRENAFLKYGISSGNSKQLFMINPYSGLLSFTRAITHQDAGTYDLEFTVKDSGTPALSATTTIYLTLTVSNKTIEILNAVHIQNDVKIHLNLVVIITLVAVTVSVIITASTSICILRYCHRRHIPQEEITTPHRCVSEQRHLICPSYHTSSCTDVPGTVLEQEKKNSHFTESRRIPHLGEEFGGGQRSSPLKPRTSTEFTHQRYIQEIAVPLVRDNHEKNTVMALSCNNWKSTIPSQSEKGHGWIEQGPGNGEAMSDLFSSQHSNPPSSQLKKFTKGDMKHLGQTFSFPSETNIAAKCFYKPNNDHSPQSKNKKAATMNSGISSVHSRLKDLPTSSCRNSYPRPLPPLPKAPN